MPDDHERPLAGQEQRPPQAAGHALLEHRITFAVGIDIPVLIVGTRLILQRHTVAHVGIAHPFAHPGIDLVKLAQGHADGVRTRTQQRRGRLGGTLLRGRKNVRKIHAVEMRGELFGLLDPLGGQRRIPAEAALAVVVRLTMPHEIQILHPAGGNDVADGRIIREVVARGFVLNAAVHGVHAYPAPLFADRGVYALVVGQPLAEAFQRFFLRHVGKLGQTGLAPDGRIQQQRIVIHAFDEQDGPIPERRAQIHTLMHRPVGRVDDGDVAALIEPCAGALHVLVRDLIPQPLGARVVGIEKLGGTAFKAEKHPAQLAVVEDRGTDALLLQPRPDAFRQRALASGGQPHHCDIQFHVIPQLSRAEADRLTCARRALNPLLPIGDQKAAVPHEGRHITICAGHR